MVEAWRMVADKKYMKSVAAEEYRSEMNGHDTLGFLLIEPQSAVRSCQLSNVGHPYSWSKESVGCGKLPLLEVP